MANKAKHAFGNLADVQSALDAGKINAYDILFLDGDTDPKVGWIDRNGVFRLVDDNTDLSELEKELATKADAAEVDAKVEQAMTDSVASAKSYTDGKVEAAINEHMAKMYEVDDVPVGTIVDYRDSEIRIMCPADAVFTKQNVGAGGDANGYYITFKTYAPDGAVGYIEHLGNQVDKEVLTDLKTDEYGRKYQPTWLAVAKYDESTGEWNYYGKTSSVNKYIGWNYQIDWYNVDGVMIASDNIRINLSNENCHYEIKPYYVGGMMTEVETMVDKKIAEMDSAYEIIEF